MMPMLRLAGPEGLYNTAFANICIFALSMRCNSGK